MVRTFFLISIYGRGVNGFSSREPFKYYVIIGLGGWVQKMAIFAYYQYIEGGLVRKSQKYCLRNIWMGSP